MDNPVDRWLFDSLKMELSGREHEYPTWSRVLGDSDPHLKRRAEYHSGNFTGGWQFNQIPDTPVESLIDAERQRLIGIVTRSAGNPQKLSTELREFVSGRPNVARWGFSTLEGADENWLILEPPWSEALDDMAAMCAEPWRSRYQNHLSFRRNLSAFLVTASQGNGDHTIQMLSSLYTDLGFPATARSFTKQILAGSTLSAQSEKTFSAASPAVPWWNRKYLDWFGSIVTDAYSSSDNCANPGPRCRELLESLASRSERDDGGRGHLFAPGLATALMLSKALRQPIGDNWMVEYREATGVKQFVWPDEATLAYDPGSSPQPSISQAGK
jgi:hypothetical protein